MGHLYTKYEDFKNLDNAAAATAGSLSLCRGSTEMDYMRQLLCLDPVH